MSLETVQQLYRDLAVAAQTMPNESAVMSMVTAFNDDLTEAQRMYPRHPLLSSLSQAQRQVPIIDLLTRTGRLQAILEEEERKSRAEEAGRANEVRRRQFGLG